MNFCDGHSLAGANLRILPVLMLAAMLAKAADAPEKTAPFSRLVAVGADGRMRYSPYTDRGDVLPDFSNCGFGGGAASIPDVPVRLTLTPAARAADDTARIQAAIDAVSQLPPATNGFRGAVLLKRGKYPIAGTLRIAAAGVVLRGEGADEAGTILIAKGRTQRTLILLAGGSGAAEIPHSRQKITNDYVPVGARTFSVEAGAKFKIGDEVMVSRIGNAAWIHEIGMDRMTPRPENPSNTKQWTAFNLDFDRVVTAVSNNTITVDAPIVCALDARWGGGEIWRYQDPGRLQSSGVEDLRGVSDFDPAIKSRRDKREYFSDEDHALWLVGFEQAKNCWARNVTAQHFYHGLASLGETAKWITVIDCRSLDPVSQLTGGRRYPFLINGQLSLVRRCYSSGARHAFVFGRAVPGPNVFLDCDSETNFATSEPHQRWAVGGLYDNVHADLAFQDRQWMGTGHGWAGANFVAWNCEGSLICQRPPTAQNFAIGFVGSRGKGFFKREEGWWEYAGRHVEPRSLYLSQLEDRLAQDGVEK